MDVTIADYLEKVKFVQSNLWQETARISYENEDEIIALNADDQLYNKGIGIDGDIVGFYKFTYDFGSLGVNPKGFPKNAGDPFNFFNTGALHSSFVLRMEGEQLIIINYDSKVNEIEAKYGNIIGLTEENKKRLNYEIIYPELMRFINNYL